MASFSKGITQFFLKIQSARESFVQKIPRLLSGADQHILYIFYSIPKGDTYMKLPPPFDF
jgi:hypothetical protein